MEPVKVKNRYENSNVNLYHTNYIGKRDPSGRESRYRVAWVPSNISCWERLDTEHHNWGVHVKK